MLLTPRLFVLEQDSSAPDMIRDVTLAKAGLPLPLPGVCVVPRGACSFRRTRLAGAGRQGLQAALLRAKQEALPGESGTLIIADKIDASLAPQTHIMASTWSFARQSEHQGRYLPETLAQKGQENGARLVKGLSGFEGQIWSNGNLVASRWWLNSPGSSEWHVFLQASQESLGPLSYDLPKAETVPWRDDLSAFAFEREQMAAWLSPFNLGAAVITVLACGYVFVGAQYLRESLVMRSAQSKIENLSDETAQILSFRRRALANQNYLKRYEALGERAAIIDALGSFATVLGATDLAIERFDLRDGQVEIRLRGEDEISVPDVVSLLEAESSLSAVSVSPDSRGSIIVLADLQNSEAVE